MLRISGVGCEKGSALPMFFVDLCLKYWVKFRDLSTCPTLTPPSQKQRRVQDDPASLHESFRTMLE